MELERCNFISTLLLISSESHIVSREDILDSVMALFRSKCDTMVVKIPLSITFREERALDAGGVLREMFSAFFEALYTRHFDGADLLHPVVNPLVKDSDLRLFGFIISCDYISCGILPFLFSNIASKPWSSSQVAHLLANEVSPPSLLNTAYICNGEPTPHAIMYIT